MLPFESVSTNYYVHTHSGGNRISLAQLAAFVCTSYARLGRLAATRTAVFADKMRVTLINSQGAVFFLASDPESSP
jgi:hypothetical protein